MVVELFWTTAHFEAVLKQCSATLLNTEPVPVIRFPRGG
jgi:hypothetical protein